MSILVYIILFVGCDERIAYPMTCLFGDTAIQTALRGHGRSAREMTLNTWVGA